MYECDGNAARMWDNAGPRDARLTGGDESVTRGSGSERPADPLRYHLITEDSIGQKLKNTVNAIVLANHRYLAANAVFPQ